MKPKQVKQLESIDAAEASPVTKKQVRRITQEFYGKLDLALAMEKPKAK